MKRMPKNNSFNEKTNSGIKAAMQASLAANDEDADSPKLKRCRGMTEGVGEHQIQLLNDNTHGMIKTRVNQLQRQSSLKKTQTTNYLNSLASMTDSEYFDMVPDTLPVNYDLIKMVKRQSFEGTRGNLNAAASATLRRATSYCNASTTIRGASREDSSEGTADVADLLIGKTTTLNGKHRRMLQAQQAWIKYQISETSSNVESFKQQRTKDTARKLLAQGGPHDKGFFKCFNLYLEEALKQYTPPAQPTKSASSEEERKF